MTPPPACTDCGEPGFVVTPASPPVVLCADCYAQRWAKAAGREQEANESSEAA